ncbi:MAG: n-acetylglutamate synthase [Hellea sp.]|nr:n-acetylglutamate synthase [Hellea sp.]
MIWYDGRLFRPISSKGRTQTNSETIFQYSQKSDRLTGKYSGGDIELGHLIGLVDDNGNINMRYHHLTHEGFLMTGKCRSRPEVLENGKIRLHERWKWTCGDFSKGTSILEEI